LGRPQLSGGVKVVVSGLAGKLERTVSAWDVVAGAVAEELVAAFSLALVAAALLFVAAGFAASLEDVVGDMFIQRLKGQRASRWAWCLPANRWVSTPTRRVYETAVHSLD
jgi:hypothetical protein